MNATARRWSVRRVTRLGLLTSVGTSLFVLESLIPLPIPFLKIGLANISTLLALILSGPADALIVVFLRVLAGSLLTGSFFGPSFILSLAAGVVSAAAMSILRRLSGPAFGPVGLSLAGSSAHVLTQLAVVALLYVRNAAVIQLLPLLLFTALVGGIVVGLITSKLIAALPSVGGSTGSPAGAIRVGLGLGDKVAIIATTAAMVCSFAFLPGAEGSTVVIQVDDQTVEKLNLRESRELTVKGHTGDVRVEIRDGRVRVVDAECPNRICVHTGWRSKHGEVIVCVPNRTIIRILGGATHEVKGITG